MFDLNLRRTLIKNKGILVELFPTAKGETKAELVITLGPEVIGAVLQEPIENDYSFEMLKIKKIVKGFTSTGCVDLKITIFLRERINKTYECKASIREFLEKCTEKEPIVGKQMAELAKTEV